MSNDVTGFRKERINKLLHELEYEVTRGIMSGDIDETMQFHFYIPISRALKGGSVHCSFSTRPVPRGHIIGVELSRLKVIK